MERLTAIIGHGERLADLSKAVLSGRLSHAYLFLGPAGVGKTTVAFAFAQAILCLNRTMPACGECRSCRLFAAGNHPDFRPIGLEGTIKIELIRELQRDVGYSPLISEHKVFLLSPLELMTEVAANGLLKTLEEPPPRVHFLGIAEDESALLATVRSRMSPVWLAPVPREEIIRGLTARGCDGERASVLAERSRGLPGVALAMFWEEAKEGLNWEKLLQRRDLAALLAMAAEAEKMPRPEIEARLEEIAAYYRSRLRKLNSREELQPIRACLSAVRTARDRLAANVNARLLLEGLFLRIYEAQ